MSWCWQNLRGRVLSCTALFGLLMLLGIWQSWQPIWQAWPSENTLAKYPDPIGA